MSGLKLHCDFETRSVVDLKAYGLDIYSKHPSTDVWCMAYAFGDEPVEVWTEGKPLPARVKKHVEDGGVVVGHNVAFEFAIWNNVQRKKFGWPLLKISQCDCTMARGYAMSLPGSLDGLAKALGSPHQKDGSGRALMLSMSKPRSFDQFGDPIWWDDEQRFQRLVKYCIADVYAERWCDENMVPLSPYEREVWLMDQRINYRGMGVDRQAAEKTLAMVERVKKDLSSKMRDVTGGKVKSISEASKILAFAHDNGVPMDGLRKHDMEEWLSMEDLPENVRDVLEIRSDGAKASVAKLETGLRMSILDGRIRGQFQYHGASTGRFAGRAMQLHNLPRPEPDYEDPELQNLIVTNLGNGTWDENDIDNCYGPFMRVISSCVRAYLAASEGYDYVGADLKNIEGVGLAFLAGEEWKMQAFRDNFFGTGPDIYHITAGIILGKSVKEISKPERQAYGKVPELALGYQGGVGAFQTMAVNYGVKISDSEAEEIKVAWRLRHPATTKYWYDLERACINAVRSPGGIYKAGAKGREIAFRVAGSFLWMQLPSGRCLCYPFPQIEIITTAWGAQKEAVTFMGTDSRVGSKTKGKWVRLSTYGGKLAENVTQAFARDILVDGMLRLEKAGYPIVLHVHDEAVAERKTNEGSVEEFEAIMSTVPAWAQGLPLAAGGFRGRRYRK